MRKTRRKAPGPYFRRMRWLPRCARTSLRLLACRGRQSTSALIAKTLVYWFEEGAKS
ncbi:hypothetical protein NBRC111894_711 [Sporolactobacillus inulinus]|uniref:Uncharacterized protein n=1 Tax=Sporolactobacillus inulinus TaxID=2078 RepID=A0A4Y1Z806_9BACL|nr:hypothetical protein NBRC111894_711 [Sporolactobacillus inulinus]